MPPVIAADVWDRRGTQRPRALSSIVEQHLGEASFLWGLRDRAAVRPHYHLVDLARLDERVEAHVDGLQIAGEVGWELALPLFEGDGESAGDLFAACQLALRRGEFARTDAVFDAFEPGHPALRAVASALAWGPLEEASPWIEALLRPDASPSRHFAGIAACCARRDDPAALARFEEPLGLALSEALRDANVALRRRALEAVGECGRVEFAPLLGAHILERDPALRCAAAWSASLLGDRSAAPVLANLTAANGALGVRALAMAVRTADTSTAHAWIMSLVTDAALTRAVIAGVGALGDPVFVPWLLECMAVEPYARIAGEALTLVTGLDLYDAPFRADPPPSGESGDELPDDPDDDLPWPALPAVASWWRANGLRLAPGRRHLLGEPVTRPHAEHVLRVGAQRQRAAAAIELSLLGGARVLPEVRAQVWRHAWRGG